MLGGTVNRLVGAVNQVTGTVGQVNRSVDVLSHSVVDLVSIIRSHETRIARIEAS